MIAWLQDEHHWFNTVSLLWPYKIYILLRANVERLQCRCFEPVHSRNHPNSTPTLLLPYSTPSGHGSHTLVKRPNLSQNYSKTPQSGKPTQHATLSADLTPTKLVHTVTNMRDHVLQIYLPRLWRSIHRTNWWTLPARFREHFLDYKYANNKKIRAKSFGPSSFLRPMSSIMYTTSKYKLLTTMKRFYINKETKTHSQINVKCTVKPNIFFDIVN
jgi:hypothetical protein